MQEPEKVAVNGENYIIHFNYRVLSNIPDEYINKC